MICWSVLVRRGVLTGSLCEFMDVCVRVFSRVSMNRLRYIREFSADDGGSSMLARFGFSAKASEHTRNITSDKLSFFYLLFLVLFVFVLPVLVCVFETAALFIRPQLP